MAMTAKHDSLQQVRIQLLGSMSPDTKKPSFPTLLTNMVKTEGISSIYAGLSAALMRQAIYGTARIGLHRTFSDKLQEVSGGWWAQRRLRRFGHCLGCLAFVSAGLATKCLLLFFCWRSFCALEIFETR